MGIRDVHLGGHKPPTEDDWGLDAPGRRVPTLNDAYASEYAKDRPAVMQERVTLLKSVALPGNDVFVPGQVLRAFLDEVESANHRSRIAEGLAEVRQEELLRLAEELTKARAERDDWKRAVEAANRVAQEHDRAREKAEEANRSLVAALDAKRIG